MRWHNWWGYSATPVIVIRLLLAQWELLCKGIFLKTSLLLACNKICLFNFMRHMLFGKSTPYTPPPPLSLQEKLLTLNHFSFFFRTPTAEPRSIVFLSFPLTPPTRSGSVHSIELSPRSYSAARKKPLWCLTPPSSARPPGSLLPAASDLFNITTAMAFLLKLEWKNIYLSWDILRQREKQFQADSIQTHEPHINCRRSLFWSLQHFCVWSQRLEGEATCCLSTKSDEVIGYFAARASLWHCFLVTAV